MNAVDKNKIALSGMQYHIPLQPGDIPEVVLLPGDPGRIHLMSEHLSNYEIIAQNREYVVARGTHKGLDIALCSTGIGCPSTAIAVEELFNIGARVFIRTGSTAALIPEANIGDLFVSIGTARFDGTSKNYLPLEYPAIPNQLLTHYLIKSAKKIVPESVSVFTGINASSDAFYAEAPDFIESLREKGVSNLEMESATLFIITNLKKAISAMICTTTGNLINGEIDSTHTDPRLINGYHLATDATLNAVHKYLDQKNR